MRLGHVEERIRSKMTLRGIDPGAIESFVRMVGQMRNDTSAHVSLYALESPDSRTILESPSDPLEMKNLEERGRELLSRVAVIKLNGGRSTNMGGHTPKGTILAKDGRCYLEIIINQVAALREKWQVDVPLVLMNSFFTDSPTMEILRRFELPVLTFIQQQVPRLVEETLMPLDTGTEEDWAPPGHGDVYDSLQRTGTLSRLKRLGCKWAFISNLDNLAAYPEPWILGLMERDNIEFLLEVTDRTPVDRKGGTLVIREGRLDLLELAQVAPEEGDSFMDINRFRVFNTNNVWIDLEALSTALTNDALKLPIICNCKNIDGARVIQLETAMGAAIGSFQRSRGLRVLRDRFFPTKKVADLFLLQSDACVLDSMFRLRRNPSRPDSLSFMPTVLFDPDFLDHPEDISKRFEAASSVSLVRANSLQVKGRAFFEREVIIQGSVEIEVPDGQEYRIPSGTVLRDGRYP